MEYFTTRTNTDIRYHIFLRVFFPLYCLFPFQILQNYNTFGFWVFLQIVTRQLLTICSNSLSVKITAVLLVMQDGGFN